MKRIALIHTVRSVAERFDESLRGYLGYEVKIHNLWDDFLADDPNERGVFTIQNRNRLFYDIRTQEMTGADLIVTTCSTLTPAVEMIRPLIQVPVIAIDDAMARKSVSWGGRIMVMATAKSTVEATISKIRKEAERAGGEKGIPVISTSVSMEAFRAMKSMDMKEHDRILKEKAKGFSGYDCIILAQASMAHLEKDISSITGCPVLTSPRLCMEEIKNKLEEIPGGAFLPYKKGGGLWNSPCADL